MSHNLTLTESDLSHQPLSLLWSTPSGPLPTTSCSSVGGCLKTPLLPGTFLWSSGGVGWCQGAGREEGSTGDWLLLAGAGRDWRRWPGPALWLTGWRWTVCMCWGWEAAIKPASGNTVRKYIYTHRRLQVRRVFNTRHSTNRIHSQMILIYSYILFIFFLFYPFPSLFVSTIFGFFLMFCFPALLTTALYCHLPCSLFIALKTLSVIVSLFFFIFPSSFYYLSHLFFNPPVYFPPKTLDVVKYFDRMWMLTRLLCKCGHKLTLMLCNVY